MSKLNKNNPNILVLLEIPKKIHRELLKISELNNVSVDSIVSLALSQILKAHNESKKRIKNHHHKQIKVVGGYDANRNQI